MVKQEEIPSSTLAAPSMEEIMEDVHGAIERALNARSEYVIKEVGSITLQKARRLLEKDLNVEQGFLDPHKDIIKGLINKLLQGAQTESPETVEPDEQSKEDDKPQMKRLKKKSDDEGVKEEEKEEEEKEEEEEEKEEKEEEEKEEEKEEKEEEEKEEKEEEEEEAVKPQVSEAGVSSIEEEVKKKPEVDNPEVEADLESLIEGAIRKRVPHFIQQADSLTVVGVRRLLEEDLSLARGALDAHKLHIRVVLNQVLNTENEEPAPVTTAKKRKAAAPESKSKAKKPSKKRKVEEVEEEDASSEDEKPAKVVRNGAKRKSAKKKVEEDASGDNDDEEEPSKEDSSEVEGSDEEETERKKVSKPKKVVESKPVYGKKVEHLKNTIKACGMTVPPSVYRKAKQAPEERREIVLIKELEGILAKEGLTGSASKDEIKAVRKKKEKLKDLEGIDTSNIIGETRGRRSRTNFFAPQRSEPVDLGDEDADEDEEEEEEDQESESEDDVEMEEDEDDL